MNLETAFNLSSLCVIVLIMVLQAATFNIIVGSYVSVEDSSTLAWIDGKVTQINEQEVHVQTSAKTVSVTSKSTWWFTSYCFMCPNCLNLFLST